MLAKRLLSRIMFVLTLFSSNIKSFATEHTELEGYKVTHIDLRFNGLLPKDKEPFTKDHWEKLRKTEIQINLKQKKQDKTVSPIEVNLKFFEDKFFEQFTGDINLNYNYSTRISFPYQITNPSEFLDKWINLEELDYIFATGAKQPIDPDFKSRSICGSPENYQLTYPAGKVTISSIPYFLSEDIKNKTIQEIGKKLKDKGSDYPENVYENLYKDCVYYKVMLATRLSTNEKVSVKAINFQPNTQEKLKLAKKDNKYWLAVGIREELNSNAQYTNFMLQTPLEIASDKINEIVGALQDNKKGYNYLELSHNPGTTKSALYFLNSAKEHKREIKSPTNNLPTEVTLDLGSESTRKWEEYRVGSPIFSSLRENLSSQNDDSSYVAMMTYALNQNDDIKTVYVMTDSLTPSMYKTFCDWSSNQKKEVKIMPGNKNLTIFSSNKKSSFTIPAKSNLINIMGLFAEYAQSFSSANLTQLEKSYKELTDYITVYGAYVLSSAIYSRIAAICHDNYSWNPFPTMVTPSNAPTLYEEYNKWISKIIREINQLLKDKDGADMGLSLIKQDISSFKTSIKNEHSLQAIYYSHLACKQDYSNTDQLNKHRELKEDIKVRKIDIKYQINTLYKLVESAKTFPIGTIGIWGQLGGIGAIGGFLVAGPVGAAAVINTAMPALLLPSGALSLLFASDYINDLKKYEMEANNYFYQQKEKL